MTEVFLLPNIIKTTFLQSTHRNRTYRNYSLPNHFIEMGLLKKTTGLTGLAVAANPHHTLGALYGKILRTLQKMPETSVYRKYTEQIVKERAGVLKQTKDGFEIEQKINCGQAEELIIQAENELNLARKMLTWKPWEPLIAKPPKGQWDWPPAKP